MILLNTTFHVHRSVDSEFFKWVETEYIPSALASGCLINPCLSRILLEVQEDCSSYAISFRSPDREKTVEWHDGEGAAIRSMLHRRFGERVLFFTTYMEEIPLPETILNDNSRCTTES